MNCQVSRLLFRKGWINSLSDTVTIQKSKLTVHNQRPFSLKSDGEGGGSSGGGGGGGDKEKNDGNKKNHENKSDDINNDCESAGEFQIKRLLKASSPLRPTSEAVINWAANPRAQGASIGEDNVGGRTLSAPEQSSIIMFPGQGNQFVGMAKNIIDYPVVKDMFGAASEILGYDLLKLCREGPEEKLNKTEYCQPALLVCSLGALERLKEEKPWAINNCSGTCGFSLGEFAALVFAGCMSFEKAISLIKLRAEAMQLCCQTAPGGMMTVFLGPGSELSKAIIDANDHCRTKGIRNSHCAVASYLFPGCEVVGGHAEALNYLIEYGQKYRLRKMSQLPVSGAFHTNLMKEAAVVFENAIKNVDFKEPLVSVYSNVSGKPYRNAKDIKKKLPLQIYLPVKWQQTMQHIFDRPKGSDFPFAYECGPGNSLSVVLKKINRRAAESCYAVKI